ncbi:MAG TPA: phosphoribosyltransferase family protein, partial [Vicinamibacteria bacterium]|nr:phosphoribosyltransferase family protein [Vicinamibacteria bacterium]
ELGPCVVAGIPCGGGVVAGPIAEVLGAPLTIVHTRKLSSPQAPEYAFGAMDEDGQVVIDYRSVVTLGLGETEVERIKAAAAIAIARQVGLYPGPRLRDLLPGRTAVLVDDGLATGLTMQAAIGYAQRHGAEATVVAVPCASERASYEMKSLLQREGDRFICPEVRSEFGSVGECYRDFGQVADEEVVEILSRARALHPALS